MDAEEEQILDFTLNTGPFGGVFGGSDPTVVNVRVQLTGGWTEGQYPWQEMQLKYEARVFVNGLEETPEPLRMAISCRTDETEEDMEHKYKRLMLSVLQQIFLHSPLLLGPKT